MKLDNRLWVVITVILSAALVAGGFFLGIQPQLDALSTAQSQKADVDAQNAALSAEIAALRTASEDLDSLRADAQALQLAVPDEMDSAEFITSLNALAAATGVTVTTISIDPASTYAPPVEDGSAPAATDSADSADAEEAAGATPSPAPAAEDGAPVAGAPLPTTNPLITGSDFVVIPVTIAIRGGYAPSLEFVEGLRTGERLILVHQMGITRSSDDGGATFETTIGALVYALPGSGLPDFPDAEEPGQADEATDPETPDAEATEEPGDEATPAPTGTPTAAPLRRPALSLR